MQFEIILHGNETPEQINRCLAALGAYAGKASKVGEQIDVATLRSASREYVAGRTSGDAVFGNRTLVLPPVAEGESEALLAKLEAENPQFGKQPLPPGAYSASLEVIGSGGSGVPLAPSPPAAPSPAVAEASASAPAAAPASIPPPPIAAGAAPSPPPAAATPAPAGAVDAKGLPWDERIHASSRAKIADGSWRMKRGVQSHVVEAVEAELRAQAPAPILLAHNPDAPHVVLAPGQTSLNAEQVAVILAPPSPPAPPAAPLPPGPPALTFGIVASRIGKAVTAGTLSGNVLSVKLAELGFPDGLHTVNARPDMWQKILDTLGA